MSQSIMPVYQTVAGIDVSKATLDVALAPAAAELHLTNDAGGHRQLAGWLRHKGVRRVGLEASGGYERAVCEGLRAAGLEVALLQPRQVRAFGHYKRQYAKNDRLDARLIAEATAQLDEVRPAPDPRLQAFAERLRLIEQMEADIARLKTRSEAYRIPRLKRWVEAEATRLRRRRTTELARLAADITKQDDLAHRLDLIASVDGVGQRTALSLLILMPELGQLDRAQIASLAGLAPYDRDTGTVSGQRRIKGGRHRVRKALYAAALPASFRWNPQLKTLYTRLRHKGKPHKQALVACARKLLIFVNTVIKRDQPWIKTAYQ